MEALLGAGQSNPSCGSVADLQAQLRDLLSSRVTETRADHTSVTFEIRATTIFDIPVTETENEALENASNIDPLLGGVRASAASLVHGNGEPTTRRVKAIDTLVNQPADDPVLQTSVTRHIITLLGQVDESVWTIRQVSRGEHGWAFTYICKDSWQAWNRQASKNSPKTAIAEWSEKGGHDPVHMARPAFDCRGSVKIAFVKSTKTIDVKYEHTPMHKTVAQLIELLAPPPIEPIVKTPAKKAKEPKPPKEPKPKTPRAPKKRAGENGAPDEEGTGPKRRRKKNDSLAPIAATGTVLPPEMPGALPVGDSSVRQLYNTQTGTPGVQQNGSGSYPEGLVSAEGDGASATVNGEVHAHSILNLPPGEAARRREAAIKLLSESNIDPETLSIEQFNIFANQSPELQQDSLTMLMRYGAERLRIVHPNKDASSSGQSTSNKQNTPGPVGGASPKPKKSRKRNSEVEDAGLDEAHSPEAASGRQRTRICDHCRIKKYKGMCDRARPSCSMCLADGVGCVYSSAGPRHNKVGDVVSEAPKEAGAEILNDDPEGLHSPGFHAESAGQAGRQPLNHSVHELAHGQEQFDGHVHHTGNASVSESMPHQAETPSDVFNQTHTFYQHSSGLGFPQVSAASAGELTQSSIPSVTAESTSMEHMSNSVSETSETALHGYSYPRPPATQKSTLGYAGDTTIAVKQGQRGGSGTQVSTPRRSVPVGQPSHGSGTSGASLDAQNNWQPLPGTPTQTVSAPRTSPRQSRKPAPVAQAYDDLGQQQASSWSASQSVAQTSQPVRNSPSQTAAQPARVRSRQSNRPQSHTPVNSTSASQQALADNSGYASAAVAQQSSSAEGFTYDQYQGGNTQADSSGDRVGYQPYSSSQTPAQSTSYASFDEYNNSLSNTAATSGSQNVASSYPSSSATAPSAAQWGSLTSNSQGRTTRANKATQSASGTASYTPQTQSQSLQEFSVRPQPSSAQARGSPSTYSQQLQQQQHRQQQGQQHHPPQQQQHQHGYNGYMNQQQQQQQQQQASSSQQSWYGFGAAANSASSGYNSAATASGNNAYSTAAATSHAHGNGGHGGHGHQAQQQQRSMDLSSHTCSSMDGEHSLYELLRSNPAG